MTSFAFIAGCVPLAFASGSGAVARQVIGTGVIGGMLAASVMAIFLIPSGFCIVERVDCLDPSSAFDPVARQATTKSTTETEAS